MTPPIHRGFSTAMWWLQRVQCVQYRKASRNPNVLAVTGHFWCKTMEMLGNTDADPQPSQCQNVQTISMRSRGHFLRHFPVVRAQGWHGPRSQHMGATEHNWYCLKPTEPPPMLLTRCCGSPWTFEIQMTLFWILASISILCPAYVWELVQIWDGILPRVNKVNWHLRSRVLQFDPCQCKSHPSSPLWVSWDIQISADTSMDISRHIQIPRGNI